MAVPVTQERVEMIIGAFVIAGGPRFTRVAALAGITTQTAIRVWNFGWPSIGVKPVSQIFYERTGGVPPAPKPDTLVNNGYTVIGSDGAAPGPAAEGTPQPQPTPDHNSAQGSTPPTHSVQVVLLDQKEIDRRVGQAVGVVKRDVAAALEAENQNLKVLRNNTLGLALSVQKALASLQPVLDNLPEMIRIEQVAGKLSVAKVLALVQTVAKAASTVTYVAGASMQHQRLLAGMPQQITESRTGDAGPPSTDPTEDMTTKLITQLAMAHAAAAGADTASDDEYQGEEPGRADAIDVDVEGDASSGKL